MCRVVATVLIATTFAITVIGVCITGAARQLPLVPRLLSNYCYVMFIDVFVNSHAAVCVWHVLHPLLLSYIAAPATPIYSVSAWSAVSFLFHFLLQRLSFGNWQLTLPYMTTSIAYIQTRYIRTEPIDIQFPPSQNAERHLKCTSGETVAFIREVRSTNLHELLGAWAK